MSDFWAGYISGAASILIGNPLDLLKTRLQAGTLPSPSPPNAALTSIALPPSPQQPLASPSSRFSSLARGATAPILGYGLLNALLFASYNRTLLLLADNPSAPLSPWKVWGAGAVGGLATFVVSAPTELVKCRAQVGSGPGAASSWGVAREIWGREGVRGLYWGGGITSVRDAVGYGF